MTRPLRVFLIAGEPSGDRLGGALMAGLAALRPAVAFDGVGGPEMAAQGLISRFPMAELSLMGLVEILPRYRHLQRRIAETAEAVLATRPDLLVTIDSPDFCFRVARAVRTRARIRTVHYVAPTVWAWRPGRAARIAPIVDQVLALFPFEPPWLEAAGIPCDFVGHPVVAEAQASAAEAAAFRAEVAGEGPLLLVLPGSRRGEVARLSDRFGAALAQVAAARPGTRAVLPAALPVRDQVRAAVRDWPLRPLVIDPAEDPGGRRKRAAFRAADAALAASGTVSLELAAAGTPMVIGYDLAPVSRALARLMLRIDTFTLVNLVTGTRSVPEFIGRACRPGPMAAALLALLEDASAQKAAMAATMAALGQGGPPPGLRAAQAVLARLEAAG